MIALYIEKNLISACLKNHMQLPLKNERLNVLMVMHDEIGDKKPTLILLNLYAFFLGYTAKKILSLNLFSGPILLNGLNKYRVREKKCDCFCFGNNVKIFTLFGHILKYAKIKNKMIEFINIFLC
jgi:hypothetical protein